MSRTVVFLEEKKKEDGEGKEKEAPTKSVGNFAVGTPEYFDALANRNARSITLIPEPNGESAVINFINDAEIIKDIHGIPGRSYFLLAMEAVLGGEAASTPKLRHPPLPAARVKKLLNGCMAARGEFDHKPAPGDMYALFDGGRTGLIFYSTGLTADAADLS